MEAIAMQKKFRPKKWSLLVMGAVFFISLFLVIFIFRIWGGTTQPLAFNHKLHAENDLTCQDCHIHFMDHASSGRPTLEICAMCHEEPQTESSEEKKLLAFIQAGEEIPWKRLYHVAEDVFFSHRIHVATNEIECTVCHGDIGESTRPPAKAKKITMQRCISCHQERQVSIDCIACHR